MQNQTRRTQQAPVSSVPAGSQSRPSARSRAVAVPFRTSGASRTGTPTGQSQECSSAPTGVRPHPIAQRPNYRVRARSEVARAQRCVRLTHVVGSCSVCGRYGTVVHLLGDERARCAHCCPVCHPRGTVNGSVSAGPFVVLGAAARSVTALEQAEGSTGPAPEPVLSACRAPSPAAGTPAVPSVSPVPQKTMPRATTRPSARRPGVTKAALKKRAGSAPTTARQTPGPKQVQQTGKPTGRNKTATPKTASKNTAVKGPIQKGAAASAGVQKGTAKTVAAKKAATKGSAP